MECFSTWFLDPECYSNVRNPKREQNTENCPQINAGERLRELWILSTFLLTRDIQATKIHLTRKHSNNLTAVSDNSC